MPLPDARGRFGPYGGMYVPETLAPALLALEKAYGEAKRDPGFKHELDRWLKTYAGRPTPLTFAGRLTEACGGARIYLKREDLLHTGAHKINNTLGQCLLARRMGKRRVIAETGAGQHGVATATAAAALGLSCAIYMGTEDIRRQAPNVTRMRLLGADVRSVDKGSKTLKDAITEAMRDWMADPEGTFYVFGSVLGSHPYPMIVRDFQAVIGREAKKQSLEAEGKLPAAIVACVGGGSNAIGIFTAFLADESVRLVGVEAGGSGDEPGRHAARFFGGSRGVLHGTETIVLQDEHGQILGTHSIAAGLDYPAVGPEHAHLKETGRAEYARASDADALAAFHRLARLEGILPALESAHALAHAEVLAKSLPGDACLLVNLSGRGDKDVDEVTRQAAGGAP